MEMMLSSGVQRSLNCTCPMASILAIGRRTLVGKMSLTGMRNGGILTPRLQSRGREEGRFWQHRFVNPYSKQVGVSQDATKCISAQVGSKQRNPSGGKDGVSSAPRYLDTVQKRRQGTLCQQAVLQETTIASSSSGMYGIETDSSDLAEVIRPDLLQGTKEWLDLRKNRITASSFGNALGFWGARRVELWEEKIGIREPFAGNAATVWGSSAEANAIEKYKEITGNGVDHVAFKIYHAGDEYLSWLGASPDGLITYNNVEGAQDSDEGVGILEVKCPHNKGRPELGSPWDCVPHYYMPQAQGLLEIFDRKHMDFYVWKPNGSSVFRIERNPAYWGLMFRLMSEFWWGHVVPAKLALVAGKSIAEVQAAFSPVEDAVATERIVSMSRHLSQNSRLIWRESRGQIQRLL
ncbi:unnamed protein product [Calypogeia fissa]